jgi:hypothetical protein
LEPDPVALLVRSTVEPEALAVTREPESPLNFAARFVAIVVGVSFWP